MKLHLSIFSIAIIFLYACSPVKQIERSAIKNVLADSALHTAHVGISVYDPSTGKYLYNYQGDKYFVPASNTKIPTCYSAMKYLGDSLVGLRYYKQGTGLLVLPSGDPTFYHPDFQSQPVLDFIRNDSSQPIIWSDHTFKAKRLGSGWSWNDYMESYMAERSAFPIHGNLVRIKDTANTIPKVYINKATFGGAYPNGYRIERSIEGVFTAMESDRKFTEVSIPFVTDPIFVSNSLSKIFNKSTFSYSPFFENITIDKIIYSQPTDSLLKPMMHRSDNFFAEQSLLMVSNEVLGVMDDGKIIDSLLKTDFKDLPQRPRWADGSGLSRFNLFTPQDFVVILNKMKNEFGMERIKTILPTGNEGTLENYYTSEEGYIFAKTGTLSGVLALSGFIYTKKNKLLIFSILINNHLASATQVRRAMEKFVKSLREKN